MLIKVFCLDTFRETLRKKVLYFIFLITFLLILATPRIPSFQVGVQITLFKDISLGLVSLSLIIMGISLSVSQIPKEIESHTIYNILSKPVRRWEFFLGKYLGVMLTIFLAAFIIGFIIILIAFLNFSVWDFAIFKGVLAILFESALINSFVFLVSIFATPTVNVFLGLFFYLIGHFKPDLTHLLQNSSLKAISPVIKFILPNLESFNLNEVIGHNVPVKPLFLFQLFLYSLSYTLFFLLLGLIFFEKKDV